MKPTTATGNKVIVFHLKYHKFIFMLLLLNLIGFVQVVFRDQSRIRYSKIELSQMLLSSDQEGELSNDPAWMLFISVTQYRFVKTMAFMIDLQSEVAQLSLRFQSSNVTPSDVVFSVQTCLRQLNRLKTENSSEFAEFLRSKHIQRSPVIECCLG